MQCGNRRTAAIGDRATSQLEKDFARAHAWSIAPQLSLLREKQRRLSARTRRAFVLTGVAVLAAGLASMALFGLAAGGILALAGAIPAAILVFKSAARRSDAFARELQDLVIAAVSQFLELRLQRAGPEETYLVPFLRHGLVQPARRRALSNEISGSHRGTRFTAAGAFLENDARQRSPARQQPHERRMRQQKVFGGILVTIQSPITAHAPILVLPRRSEFGELLADAFDVVVHKPPPEIAVEDEAFSARFTAHSDDARAAQRFLTPAFLRAVQVIEEERARGPQLQGWPNARIGAAFVGDELHIAMPRRDILPLRWVSEEIEERINAIFDDLTLVHRIIDALHGD